MLKIKGTGFAAFFCLVASACTADNAAREGAVEQEQGKIAVGTCYYGWCASKRTPPLLIPPCKDELAETPKFTLKFKYVVKLKRRFEADDLNDSTSEYRRMVDSVQMYFSTKAGKSRNFKAVHYPTFPSVSADGLTVSIEQYAAPNPQTYKNVLIEPYVVHRYGMRIQEISRGSSEVVCESNRSQLVDAPNPQAVVAELGVVTGFSGNQLWGLNFNTMPQCADGTVQAFVLSTLVQPGQTFNLEFAKTATRGAGLTPTPNCILETPIFDQLPKDNQCFGAGMAGTDAQTGNEIWNVVYRGPEFLSFGIGYTEIHPTPPEQLGTGSTNLPQAIKFNAWCQRELPWTDGNI